jgi:hypothetical protein
MGKYMMNFLKTMHIPATILSTNEISEQISTADRTMKKLETPVALIMKKGVIE